MPRKKGRTTGWRKEEGKGGRKEGGREGGKAGREVFRAAGSQRNELVTSLHPI